MERLQQRLTTAERALRAFEEVMLISQPTTIERDAAIQRFEFTFEAVWKAAKQMLFDIEGVDVGSPKGVIRSSREVGLLNDTETTHALEMVNDINLTSHTYNEALAQEIYNKLWYYLQLMKHWLERMKQKCAQI